MIVKYIISLLLTTFLMSCSPLLTVVEISPTSPPSNNKIIYMDNGYYFVDTIHKLYDVSVGDTIMFTKKTAYIINRKKL